MAENTREAELFRRLSTFSVAMDSLRGEILFVQAVTEDLARGKPLSRDDLTRLHIAALRLFDAGEVLNG